MPGVTRSLRVANFRRYVGATLLSSVGMWMQIAAEPWLVYKLTSDARAVGAVTAVRFGPLLLLGLWAGSLADRHDRRMLLTIAVAAKAAIAIGFGAVVYVGVASIEVVFPLVLLYGTAQAVENPVRRSFIRELVPASLITNAVSLNTGIMTIGRVLGPAAGGLIISTAGVAWCFFFNGASYVAVLVTLLVLRLDRRARTPVTDRWYREASQSLRYVWRHPGLRGVFASVVLVVGVGWAYTVVLPPFVQETFGGGAALYGWMFATVSAGSILGAALTASRDRVGVRYLRTSAVLFGVSVLLVGVVPEPVVVFALLALAGVTGTAYLTGANAAAQLSARMDMQGRVLAAFSVALLGTRTIGGPIMGFAMSAWGPRAAFAVAGAASVAAALLWLRGRLVFEAKPSGVAPDR